MASKGPDITDVEQTHKLLSIVELTKATGA